MSLISTAQYIKYIADEFGFYSAMLNIIIGLFGNIFLILIFMNVKVFRGNQCSFYLTTESFSNIGLILAIYSSRIIKYTLGYDPTLISLSWCQIRTTFAQMFALYSLYTICSVTFDQYLTTNFQYSFRQMSTLKLSYRLTFITIIFCTLHSTLFLIFSEIHESNGCAVYNSLLKKYLSFFYYPIFGNSLPLLITITFSLLAYRNVRRIVRRQIPIVRRRLDRQLTAMVLARVICFIVLGLPFVCTTIYQLNANISENNYLESTISTLVGAISYSLLYTNFCITFYLFLAISSRFRRQVKYLLVKQVWHSLTLFFSVVTHSHNNQIAPNPTLNPISILEFV